MNYKMYTHNDLDGVGCAILGKLLWGEYLEVRYCNSPDEVTERLCKDDNSHRDLVFVTDISFNYEKVRNANHRVISKIRLFDHHKTALPLKDKGKFFVVETNREDGKLTCGTEVFYNYLKENKGFTVDCDFFVEQVRLYDTWEWTEGTSQIPKYLSMLLFTDSITNFCDTFMYRIMKYKSRLNELNIFNEKESAILEYEERRQQKELEKCLKNTYIVTTNQYTYGVVFGECNMSVVGNAICETYDVDIALNINLATGVMGARTTRNDIDLGKLMKEKYSGGGHPKAAGTPIKDAPLQTFKSIVPDSIYNFSKAG